MDERKAEITESKTEKYTRILNAMISGMVALMYDSSAEMEDKVEGGDEADEFDEEITRTQEELSMNSLIGS